MATKKTLINFIVDDPLLKRIEDFRFKNRFPTRAAAIKWLLDWAIKQKPPVKGLAPEVEEEEDDLPTIQPVEQSSAQDPSTPANAGEPQDHRAAAISALFDLVLKQKSSERGQAPKPEPDAEAKANPVEPPPLNQAMSAAAPSRESITQALRDQGYEVGDVVRHPDGHERILVRSQDRSAWVNVVQELQDLAAARITIADVAERRRAAGR